jgi:DNA ligase 1
MLKLKQLKETQGNIAKKEFLLQNKDDVEFMECLRFLLDDFIITNISRKKYDKVQPSINPFNNIFEVLDYLKHSTGSDENVRAVKSFAQTFTGDEKEIVEGLINKDYALSFGVKFFNEVMKDNPIIESPYMGAVVFDKKKVLKLIEQEGRIISQTKSDGMFSNIYLEKGRVKFTGRSGLPIYINGKLKEDANKLANYCKPCVMTGELLMKGYDRQTANGIIRGLVSSNEKIEKGDLKECDKFKKKYGQPIEYFESLIYCKVWDLIQMEEFLQAQGTEIYRSRLDKLSILLSEIETESFKVIDGIMVGSFTEVMAHFKHLLSQGEEGTIVKSMNGVFKDGKPVYQIKIKLEMGIELKIVGFNAGKPKTKYENTLGSLQMESECGKLKTDMSGLSDSMRDEIWNNKDKYLGMIVEVKANGVSSNRDGGYSLLYPSFVEVRDNKLKADTLEEILEIEKSISEVK